jgi:hypothetical protein
MEGFVEELARQEADGNFICVALEVSKHSSARAIHFESLERHEITQRSQ